MSRIDGPSTLDLFLLTVMADGVAITPYELVRRLGISPGASIPALRRLHKQGLVAKESTGPRRRQAFTLTKEGNRLLNRPMREFLENQVGMTPLDTESISRAVALAWSENGHLIYAVRILEAAMKKCDERALAARAKLPPLEAKRQRGTTEEIYTWVRTTMESARWQAQKSALKRIHSRLTTKSYRKKTLRTED